MRAPVVGLAQGTKGGCLAQRPRGDYLAQRRETRMRALGAAPSQRWRVVLLAPRQVQEVLLEEEGGSYLHR